MWPGQPMTAHWGIEDPAAVEGTDIQKEAASLRRFAISKIASPPSRACRWRASIACRSEHGCAISAAARAQRPARKRPADVRLRSAAPPDRGSARHRDPGRNRRWLRHHGGDPDQGRRAGAARQHDPDRRDPRGADHDSWSDLGRAFQSGRDTGVCAPARTDAGRGAVVCGRAGRRRHRGDDFGACDVRAAIAGCLAQDPNRRRAMARGRCRRVRPGRDHFGRHPFQAAGDPLAGRALHHGSLLVHVVDVVCQSRRCHRAIADEYVLRHSAHRSSRLHRSRTLRRDRGDDVDGLAAARGRPPHPRRLRS